MNEDLKKEQYELEGRSELLTEADEKFSIAVATILSLGNNAYQIFQSSKVETKREIFVRRKMDLHNWDSGINRDFGGHIGIRYL